MHKLLFLIIGVLIVGTFLFSKTSLFANKLSKNDQELLSPLIEVLDNPQVAAASEIKEKIVNSIAPKASGSEVSATPKSNAPIDKVLSDFVNKNSEIDFSIEVMNITTGKKYSINQDKEVIGASTTKLFTASAFLTQLEKGTYTYDTKLGTYNTKFQLQQLINQSNNISWELFYDLLGRSKIEAYTHSINSKGFVIKENSLKVGDMTNYLTKLYTNKLHSKETTQSLLNLMQKTNEETFVPTVPGYTIYHKNGQLEEVVNEAVIAVNKEGTVFAISIYSDGKDKWEYSKRTVMFKTLITSILSTKH